MSRILPPGGIRKRKEREGVMNRMLGGPSSSADAAATEAKELMSPNRLLAGYMAHEFLTKGTLFGQKFDAARAQAVPLAGSDSASNNSYSDVASLVKSDGTYIPGIVNPTQLSRWVQM